MKKTALTIAVAALLLTAAAPAWARPWHRRPVVKVVVVPRRAVPAPRVIVVDRAPCYVPKRHHRPHRWKKRVHKRPVRHHRSIGFGIWVPFF
jgi:hypothetical protein